MRAGRARLAVLCLAGALASLPSGAAAQRARRGKTRKPATRATRAASRQAVASAPPGFVGCWALALSPWTPAAELGTDSVFITPPARIELTADSSIDARPTGLVVRPAPGTRATIHRFVYWERLGPDSLRIVFSTGFSGVLMRLARSGETLRGSARTFWDAQRPVQTSAVTATPIPCAPPAPTRER